MRRMRLAIISFFGIFLFSNCSDDGARRLPRFSGAPGEVLVVMDEKPWMQNPGDSLRKYLEAPYPQLPQAEASFSILHFASGEMNDLLRLHRNIIQVVIGADAENQDKITFQRSRWSSGQLVFTIRAVDKESYYALLRTDIPKLIETINETEVDRLQDYNKEFGNDQLEAKIEQDFGISLNMPSDFEVAVEGAEFIWLKRDRIKYKGNTAHEITQGLIIFTYPYLSDTALKPSALMQVRDSLLKKYIPGPKEGTYMTTEYRFPPTSEVTTKDNKYAVETRGLWKTENYFMGGPFIDLSTTTKKDEKVISISGFAFAPNFKKREFLRELEAILKSASIPQE